LPVKKDRTEIQKLTAGMETPKIQAETFYRGRSTYTPNPNCWSNTPLFDRIGYKWKRPRRVLFTNLRSQMEQVTGQ
jgi:hypothetical protein